jgi:hypothetical protein
MLVKTINTPLTRIRASIGDIDGSLVSDDVINYLLLSHTESSATIECLKYIVSGLTQKVDQEVGDVKLKYSQLLKNYKTLLNDFITNPAFSSTLAVHQILGTCDKIDLGFGSSLKYKGDETLWDY